MAKMVNFRLCVFHLIFNNFPQTVVEIIEKKEKQKLNTFNNNINLLSICYMSTVVGNHVQKLTVELHFLFL